MSRRDDPSRTRPTAATAARRPRNRGTGGGRRRSPDHHRPGRVILADRGEDAVGTPPGHAGPPVAPPRPPDAVAVTVGAELVSPAPVESQRAEGVTLVSLDRDAGRGRVRTASRVVLQCCPDTANASSAHRPPLAGSWLLSLPLLPAICTSLCETSAGERLGLFCVVAPH